MADEELKELVFCPSCNRQAEVPVLFSKNDYHGDEDRGHGILTILAECQGCGQQFLRHQHYDWYDTVEVPGTVEQLFPPDTKFDISGVPSSVSKRYQEAARCLATGSFEASVVMCRKALDAVCHEFGQKKGTLAGRLAALRDTGTIEGRLFNWADGLRLVGNEGAHELDDDLVTTQEDAQDALQFLEALMSYLFVLMKKHDEFMDRRSRRRKGD